jgi:hypothetical protein
MTFSGDRFDGVLVGIKLSLFLSCPCFVDIWLETALEEVWTFQERTVNLLVHELYHSVLWICLEMLLELIRRRCLRIITA